MRDILEQLLRATGEPNPERAEHLWAEYRAGGVSADAAFATLMAWYGGTIYRRIWGFVRSDAADDVFQDVLVRLHRERTTLVTFEHALRWLRTVAASRCVDAHRSETRRAARERERAVCADSAAPQVQAELQEALRVGLSKLSAQEQEAVAQVFFEGMTRRDAAAAAGVHRDTFAKLLDGALAKLRAALATVGGAGGVFTVESALAARPPLSADHLTRLTTTAWERAVQPAVATGWTKAVLGATLLTGGLALGGWALLRDAEPPRPREPGAIAKREEAPAKEDRETLQQKHRRVFDAEVRPKVERAIQKLAPANGGSARIAKVDVYDTRLELLVHVRHGESRPMSSHLKVVYDTRGGDHRVLVDLLGTGKWQGINPAKPMYWTVPGVGELVFRFEGIDDVLKAFRDVSWTDPRLDPEHANRIAEFRKAAEPFLGTWYEDGNPAKPFTVRFDANHHTIIEYTWHHGLVGGRGVTDLTVAPDGRLVATALGTIAPNGVWHDFPEPGRTATRQPTKQ